MYAPLCQRPSQSQTSPSAFSSASEAFRDTGERGNQHHVEPRRGCQGIRVARSRFHSALHPAGKEGKK